jgi:hypothetical protein
MRSMYYSVLYCIFIDKFFFLKIHLDGFYVVSLTPGGGRNVENQNIEGSEHRKFF